MILKKGSMSEFAHRIKETGKQIIVYGAGVVGQTAAPYWLHEHQLVDSVLCYVDADPHKQGNTIRLSGRQIPTKSLSVLEELCGEYILLVSVSAFEPVIQTLSQMHGVKSTEIYFLPVMLLDMAHKPKEGGVIRTSDTPLIPKRIHYCWFSGNPIHRPLQQCIDSWKRVCPDYEIIRWDESNYDICKNKYMQQAYAHQKWGYIPDYARLDIIYHYGGIYLDTDVELIRNLDELLYQPAFCSTEKWGVINMGICGAQPGNADIQAMLTHRASASFLYPDGTENLISSGIYDTLPLVERGLQLNGKTQVIPNGTMIAYASEFFQPFDYISGETYITKNTFSIHHFSGTWLGAQAQKERENTRKRYHKFVEALSK